MKKILLTLVAIVATSLASFSQITLGDAYSRLADLPGMKEKSGQTVNIVSNAAVNNVQTASLTTTNGVQNMRDQFIYMIESLPIRNMLVGANNQREMAVVFAEPAAAGSYNILILQADTLNGQFTASYGQTDKAGVDAIRNCDVSMDASNLEMTASMGSSTADFISMNP